MSTASRSKIWLAAAAGPTAVALATAAGAGANVRFDPQTDTGFVGRGM